MIGRLVTVPAPVAVAARSTLVAHLERVRESEGCAEDPLPRGGERYSRVAPQPATPGKSSPGLTVAEVCEAQLQTAVDSSRTSPMRAALLRILLEATCRCADPGRQGRGNALQSASLSQVGKSQREMSDP